MPRSNRRSVCMHLQMLSWRCKYFVGARAMHPEMLDCFFLHATHPTLVTNIHLQDIPPKVVCCDGLFLYCTYGCLSYTFQGWWGKPFQWSSLVDICIVEEVIVLQFVGHLPCLLVLIGWFPLFPVSSLHLLSKMNVIHISSGSKHKMKRKPGVQSP